MHNQRSIKVTITLLPVFYMLACVWPVFAIVPSPIISIGRPTYSNANNASNATDGSYTTDIREYPSSDDPFYIAIDLGATTSSRVLLKWNDRDGWSYWVNSYSPSDYTVDLSANSTNGADGDWTTVVTVTGNRVKARSHSFDLNGNTWVRMTMTAGPGSISTRITQVDIYDISDGCEDYWVFLGNSITCHTFNQNEFDEFDVFWDIITEARPRYTPCGVAASQGGFTSTDIRNNLNEIVRANPDAKYYGIMIGTNDGNLSTFEANVQAIIDTLKSIGAVPVLARTFATASGGKLEYAEKCDELTAKNNLVAGPDFYTIFSEHDDYFLDDLHPNTAGVAAIHRGWADAALAAGLYNGTVDTHRSPRLSEKTKQMSGSACVPRVNDRVETALYSLDGRLLFSCSEMARGGKKPDLGPKLTGSDLSKGVYVVKVTGGGIDIVGKYIR